MEIDVAPSMGTPEQTTIETKAPPPAGKLRHMAPPPVSDRKRKKSESSSTALKSILRQRSDPTSSCSILSQKLKRKRAVKFTLEEKAEEHRHWSDKRLRYLALDLDRWDNLPHSVLRTINKQKTRHTKRLKFCHSTDDLDQRKVTRPQMDDGASLKHTEADRKDTQTPGAPETVPEMESIEKSFFVTRWLQQSSQTPHTSSSHPHHLQYSGCCSSGRGGLCPSHPHTLPTFSSSSSSPPHCSFAALGCHHGVPLGVPPGPSVSLGAPPRFLLGPVSLQSSVGAQVTPDTTSSLQSLAVNFHTMSLKPSSWRQE